MQYHLHMVDKLLVVKEAELFCTKRSVKIILINSLIYIINRMLKNIVES